MTREDKDEIKEILREHLNVVVAGYNANLEIINYKLDSIKEQTTKTNGRVNVIEPKILDLEKSDLRHTINCPQTAKIDELNKKLEDVFFVTKYPKLFISGIVVCVILSLIAFSKSLG